MTQPPVRPPILPRTARKAPIDLKVLDDLQALRRLEGVFDHLDGPGEDRGGGWVSLHFAARHAASRLRVSRGNCGCP